MMIDFLSSIAFWTIYLALSACYWAICFSSIALVNSYPKTRSTMDTSSRIILNYFNLSARPILILTEICSLYANNVAALYWATTDFKTSLTTDGSTLWS